MINITLITKFKCFFNLEIEIIANSVTPPVSPINDMYESLSSF